eukprot:m.46025 g.46025  ORF g.46025 m.46025 type:complete len:54 (+) comp10909_c0_seq6:1904-2065(+)
MFLSSVTVKHQFRLETVSAQQGDDQSPYCDTPMRDEAIARDGVCGKRGKSAFC